MPPPSGTGTSCFYRHADKRGDIVETQLRFRLDEEGLNQPLSRVNLADFLEVREQRGYASQG